MQMRFNIEFERKGLLGRGGNSSVWLATNRLDRKDYAVKMAYYDGEIDPKVLREIIISSELNHVNIVRYFSSWTEIHPPEITGAMRDKTCLFICMELCNCGDLRNWLSGHRQNAQIIDLRNMFTQIAMGVSYLHNKNIMHRDLKPSNIYIKSENNESRVKIGDFGFSKRIVVLKEDDMEVDIDPYTYPVGTTLYWSPEMKNRSEHYNQSIDIYSMGLIYFEMLNEELVTDKEYLFEQLSFGNFPPAFEAQYGSEVPFIKSMLENNPEERATANDILIRLLPYSKGMTAQVNAIVDQLIQK